MLCCGSIERRVILCSHADVCCVADCRSLCVDVCMYVCMYVCMCRPSRPSRAPPPPPASPVPPPVSPCDSCRWAPRGRGPAGHSPASRCATAGRCAAGSLSSDLPRWRFLFWSPVSALTPQCICVQRWFGCPALPIDLLDDGVCN